MSTHCAVTGRCATGPAHDARCGSVFESLEDRWHSRHVCGVSSTIRQTISAVLNSGEWQAGALVERGARCRVEVSEHAKQAGH